MLFGFINFHQTLSALLYIFFSTTACLVQPNLATEYTVVICFKVEQLTISASGDIDYKYLHVDNNHTGNLKNNF